ncbi:MAG: sodium:calcium antiporter [Bacteroidetes bacterium SW_9_63_38]|nr:MAG: sodium:calcium antiporter [Bacteroidetes bacterium SW_9_63_38]
MLFVSGGLVCLTAGAEGIVRGASSLARRVGVSPLLIGLTVVAYGTSAPEGVVSVQAALDGAPALALGNVVGSNISNVGLILGTTALLYPVQSDAQAVQLDIPIMIGVSALFLGLLGDGVIGRLNGVVLVLGGIGYTVIRVWGGQEESQAAVREAFDEAVPDRYGWVWEGGVGIGGLALLILGGRLLVDGAVAIADGVGLSPTVIGLTVVAVGTSLPELATSVVAALRGHADLAVGNVVGSNIVNVLGVLGGTACVHPIDATGLTWIDGGVLFGTAVLTLPFLWTKWEVSRWEGGVLLAVYGSYIAFLVQGTL